MQFTISEITTTTPEAQIRFKVTSGGQSNYMYLDRTEFRAVQQFPKRLARPFIKYMINTFIKGRLDAGDTLPQVKAALLAHTFKME